jgi:hypothetical protein
MPFNGGGGGALPPHEHTNIANDGGPLNFNNTTIASMNAGDITYSDGAALQILPYPGVPAGESLTAVAASTAPSWTAAASGAKMILIDSQILLGAASTITSTFAAVNQSDVSQFVAILNGAKTTTSSEMYLTLNSIATATYDLGSLQQTTAAPTGLQRTSQSQWNFDNQASTGVYVIANITCNAVTDNLLCNITSTTDKGSTMVTHAQNSTAGQTSLSEVEFSLSSSTYQAGTRLDVYKLEI